MWAVMMVAMMVPTAAPMTLDVRCGRPQVRRSAHAAGADIVFVTGYIAMWTIFSLVATSLSMLLIRPPALPMMMFRSKNSARPC